MHNDEKRNGNENEKSVSQKQQDYYAALSGFHRAMPIILTAIAVFIGICFITDGSGLAGEGIVRLLKGLFGFGAYAIPVMIILHSFFYAEDIAKKRVLTRVIFSAITVIVVATISYAIPSWNEQIFTPGANYAAGASGGFIGTVIAFGIMKVLGPVGLIILEVAILALYLAFFFANSESTFGKFTLTVLTAFASIFAYIEKGIKKVYNKIKNAKAEKEMRESERKSDELLDDSFFDADNGMSEFRVKGLDISESRSHSSAEQNPVLQHSVRLKSEVEDLGEDEEITEVVITERTVRAEPHVRKKASLNLDYGIEDDGTIVYGNDSEAEDIFEDKSAPVSANRRDAYGIDASADSVFTASFDPFDFKQAERAASKVSSKYTSVSDTRGIKQISEPIDRLPTAEEMEYMQKVAAENAEKARRLEEFERRKREIVARSNAQPQSAATATAEAKEAHAPVAMPAAESAPVRNIPTPTVTVQKITPESEQKPSETSTGNESAGVENLFIYESEAAETADTVTAPAEVAEESAPIEDTAEVEIDATSEEAYASEALASPSLESESEDIREIVKIVTYGTKAMNDEPAEELEPATDEESAADEERIEPVSADETDEEIALRIAQKIAEKNPTYLRSANEMHTFTQIKETSSEEAVDTTAEKSVDNTDEETPVVETTEDDGTVTFEFVSDTDEKNESESADFRPFESAEDIISIETADESEDEPTLELERTMLSPTADVSEEELEIVFTGDETVEAEEEPEPEAEDALEEGTVFTFDTDDDESEDIPLEESAPEDEDDADMQEIPPEEQNPDVIKQREMFPFLDQKEDEPVAESSEEDSVTEAEAESSVADAVEEDDAVTAEETADTEEEATDGAADEAPEAEDEEDDLPPFDNAVVAPIKASAPEKKEPAAPPKPDYSNYEFPSIDLLGIDHESADDNVQNEIQENADRLIDTLASFNVTASIKGVDRGPRITRYEVVPAKGVKVSSIMNLQDDIALSLAADGIRMEAPIPGKSAVGVEIPNKKSSTVRLRELIETEEFKSMKSKTAICIGKDVAGQPVINDISKMPHLLIAGATGMGKSVCINSLLISILYKARPDEVKLIMIDPKQVEFTMYNGIPHLLIPVVSDAKQAAGALMWAVDEMERRYNLLNPLCVRNIDAYNEKIAQNPSLGEPMSKIVIVIDEFADLMLQVKDPVENLVMRIAQKARAAGIHLIIGTQRPSTNVITGTIKANIPSRMSCKVASNIDSRTVLDTVGAEKLLNKGDMLFNFAGAIKPLRVQGAFVADGEAEAIMAHLKQFSNGASYDEAVMEEIKKAADKCSKKSSGGGDSDDGGDDSSGEGYLNDKQFLDAVDIAVSSGRLSTALLQRKLSIGYGKAARFIDVMCDMGIISEPNGQKPREVLITADEWHEKLSRTMIDG